MRSRKLSSRREFLRLTTLGAASAAILAACAPAAAPSPTAAPAKPTEAPKPAATTAPAAAAPTATPAAAAKPTEAPKPTAAAAASPTAAAKPTTAAAAATKPNYKVPTFPLKLGFVGPLTGNVKTFGESTKNGFELAVAEANEAGGKVTFVEQDDKNDPAESVNAVTKMITSDKVKAIIGSVTSATTIPDSDVANSNKVLLVTSTATNPKVTVADGKRKEYVFRACFIDDFQGSAMANYVLNTLKLKKAAVLYDVSNDYTKGLAEFFRDAFKKGGGTVNVFESYGKDDVDFSALLTKVAADNPEFLYLPDYYNKVNLIAKQANEKGIKAVKGGGDGWDSAELDTKETEGGVFTNHYSPDDPRPEVQNWVAKYKAKYGSVPDALATLAYDATTLVLAAAGEAGSDDPTKMKDALVAMKDFPVVSGKITFDKNGNPNKVLAIIAIKGGKYTFAGSAMP